MNAELLTKAKSLGFSDRQIAHLTGQTEDAVRAERKKLGLVPSYRLVDTCAAEFEAYTPYYYSTYDRGDDEVKPSDRKKVMILGGGPNRIGQGIEFDYCCVHAAFALKEDGFETLMVNSNPETVSTDYDTSDRLYFEPLTLEDVLHIYEREKCWGAIAQFGGQTPLNLALGLQKNGVNIIGTSPQSIEIAEDRKLFAAMLHKLKIPQPPNGLATSEAEALAVAAKLGYPLLVRPSFVLGGRAMQIVYSDAELQHYMRFAVEASPERPVLVDQYLEDATEVDVDCIADIGNFYYPNQGTIVIGGILEHIEFAGVHSGDAAMVLPPHTLSQRVINTIREYTHAMARELKVVGLMNVQYAVKGETVYVLEVNPRASRTVPFVSKAIGVPLAKLAARVMAGKTLKQLKFTKEIWPQYWAVKESVFPFNRFHGQDILLSPEMRSTGEVMGLDDELGIAYAKSQMAAGGPLPTGGRAFISVSDSHKGQAAEVAQAVRRPGLRVGGHQRHRGCVGEGRAQSPAHLQIGRRPAQRCGPPEEPRNPDRDQHALRRHPARGRSEDPHHGGLYRHAHHDHAQRRQSRRPGHRRSAAERLRRQDPPGIPLTAGSSSIPRRRLPRHQPGTTLELPWRWSEEDCANS